MSNRLTPKSTTDLCASCQNSLVRENTNGHRTTLCNWMTPAVLVHDPTSYCNKWSDAKAPTLYEYKEIAWVVVSDGRTKLGFRRFVDLSQDKQTQIERELHRKE